MNDGNVWALVPVKPLREAKTRLSSALSDVARTELAEELLRHTLSVLCATKCLHDIVVVSRDPDVQAIAHSYRVSTLPDGADKLAPIVDGALHTVRDRGARAALVVLADLPELSALEVERLVDFARDRPVVIAPDDHDEGTNALWLWPPDRMPTCFGRWGSFQAHLDRANEHQFEAAVFPSLGFGFDLDTVSDLERLVRANHPRFASLASIKKHSLTAGPVS